ncbi:YfiR family protein [Marinicella meishanensis]|uniref:YfiR family protein n=1 Tax=Marinicella meishanensis TaxID=2873263 RepID=UPI001CC13FBF|nr:YfiR family protein [Marinicella sp. NBU2979]
MVNPAAAENNFEAKLKAAYLVNIAKFTTWVDAPESIHLCIFSQATIIDEVRKLNGFSDEQLRAIEVIEDPVNLQQCHMLYLDAATFDPSQSNLIQQAHGGLLTISDMRDALKNDVAIQFFVRNLKLRFAINRAVISNSEYKISSKLLRLSKQME